MPRTSCTPILTKPFPRSQRRGEWLRSSIPLPKPLPNLTKGLALDTSTLPSEPKAAPTPLYHLYVDDTGTRRLDKLANTANQHPRWFALGGYLIADEDEEAVKEQYDSFCAQWPKISGPLHITDMRARRKDFSWLEQLSAVDQNAFWVDYCAFLAKLPVFGIACVIHRPGYLARGYGGRQGDAKWNLCRSAFNILVERAAKFAHAHGRRLRVKYEGADPDTDQALKGYFALLKNANGLGFNPQNASKYDPMDPLTLKQTLLDLERKTKKSKLMQIADSYVYAIAKGRYEPDFNLYSSLVGAQRLVDYHVPTGSSSQIGIKYYCFDGV